jgi:hypothetical protein
MNIGIIDSSQKIITNGLVLHLDAAQKRSYSGTGTVWTDLSGNGNNGTLTNSPTFDSANGGSIVFDGTNDFINLNSLNSLFSTTSQNITFSFWLRFNGSSTTTFLFLVFSTGFNGGRFITITNSNIGAFLFVTSSPSNSSTIDCSLSNITNVWTNIVVVWNGTNYIIFRDGLELSFTSRINLSSSATGLGNTPVRLGVDSITTRGFPGRISTTLIYNRALSAAEVLQNYNATKSRFGL